MLFYENKGYFCVIKFSKQLFEYRENKTKLTMTEEQERRRRWIFQVLDLINIEREDFDKRLTKKGTQELIDELLDELYSLIHTNQK